jgi:transcriptional regulator with XRE-family HTH domain
LKKENVSIRLKAIMKERKLRQIDILNKAKPFCDKYGVKLNKSDLSQYVSGLVEPGQEKLTILGESLGVSEAWLMGFDVPRDRLKSTEIEENIFYNYILNKESGEKYIVETYGKNVLTLLSNYSKLSKTGKAEAELRVEELTLIDRYI